MGKWRGKSGRTSSTLAVFVATLMLTLSLCGAARANYFDGMESDANTNNHYTGARVNIDNYLPHYTTGGFVCAWPMLHNVYYGGSNAIAQIGWIRGTSQTNDTNLWYFYEYEATSGFSGIQVLTQVPDGSIWEVSHLYTVQYDGADIIRYRIDGVLKHATTYADWLPTQGQWYGEHLLANDYYPGDSQYPAGDSRNHRVRFYNPSEYSNGAWHFLDPSGRMFKSDDYAGQSHSTANHDFHTWDKRAQW